MGCHSSKLDTAISGDEVALTIDELISFYEEACGLIPDLKYLIPSMNFKKFLLKNHTLISISKDYLKTTLLTIKFLTSLKTSISKARQRHAIILQALQCFELENNNPSFINYPSYSQTLEKLKEYTEAENPFGGPLAYEFASLRKQHESMRNQLISKRDEIRDKLKSSKKWKKVWKVTCTAAFISALVLSVALAAMSAPPASAGAAAVGSTMIKTGEQWFDAWWDRRLGGLEGARDVMGVMWRGGVVRVHEMESIRALMGGLEIGLGSVTGYAWFAMQLAPGGRDEVAPMVMGEVKGKVGVVEERLDGVEMKVDACGVEIRKAVVEFLKVITDDTI